VYSTRDINVWHTRHQCMPQQTSVMLHQNEYMINKHQHMIHKMSTVLYRHHCTMHHIVTASTPAITVPHTSYHCIIHQTAFVSYTSYHCITQQTRTGYCWDWCGFSPHWSLQHPSKVITEAWYSDSWWRIQWCQMYATLVVVVTRMMGGVQYTDVRAPGCLMHGTVMSGVWYSDI